MVAEHKRSLGIHELDDFHGAAARQSDGDIHPKHSGQELGPRSSLGFGLRWVIVPEIELNPWVFILLWSRHHVASVFGVCCKNAMVPKKMKSRRWHQGAKSADKVQRLKDNDKDVCYRLAVQRTAASNNRQPLVVSSKAAIACSVANKPVRRATAFCLPTITVPLS